MDIIIIPTCSRPEMLAICLERLAEADLIQHHMIWIEKIDCQNENISREIDEVIRGFDLNIAVFPKSKRPICDNFYELFWQAYLTNSDLVYFMEDDVLVTKDFFRWSRQAMQQFEPFLTIGVNCWTQPGQDPLAVTLTTKDYQQWGACIKRQNIPMIRREHDRIMEEVMHNHIIEDGLQVIFPSVPRAYNVGFYGADSTEPAPIGSLSEKIVYAREKSLTKPGFWQPFRQTPGWSGQFYIKDLR